MYNLATPGVYRRDVLRPKTSVWRTGIPAFLSFVDETDERITSLRATRWAEVVAAFDAEILNSHTGAAILGFFENGGTACYIVPLLAQVSRQEALLNGLELVADTADDADLIAAPNLVQWLRKEQLPPLDEFDTWQAGYVTRLLIQNGVAPNPEKFLQLQQTILDWCDSLGSRFAMLDPLPGARMTEIMQQRRYLSGTNGALYYPQLDIGREQCVPPSGHIAGIIARTDATFGVHKAPANEQIEAAIDLETQISPEQQSQLNPIGVNALRTFPGRGVRVWGARTVSNDPAWRFINVRRLVLTIGRWLEYQLAGVVFEPNDAILWARIRREATAFLTALWQQGALSGESAEEAFYVKCDAETNPETLRQTGRVSTEIGVVPTMINEFVVVRIVHDEVGTQIAFGKGISESGG